MACAHLLDVAIDAVLLGGLLLVLHRQQRLHVVAQRLVLLEGVGDVGTRRDEPLEAFETRRRLAGGLLQHRAAVAEELLDARARRVEHLLDLVRHLLRHLLPGEAAVLLDEPRGAELVDVAPDPVAHPALVAVAPLHLEARRHEAGEDRHRRRRRPPLALQLLHVVPLRLLLVGAPRHRRQLGASLLAARHRLDLDDLLLLVEGRHERAERLLLDAVEERAPRALQVAFRRLARRLRSSSLSRVEDVLRLLERHVDGFCSFYGGFGGLRRLRLHDDG